MWEPIGVELDTKQDNSLTGKGRLLYDLADGKYPALLIKNFYDKDLCRIIANRISEPEVSHFDYGTGIIKKLGIFLMEYANNNKKRNDYFAMVPKVEERFSSLFYGIEDPRKRIHDAIANLMPGKIVIIAQDNGRRYSCGIIRIHEMEDHGPLHRDNASADAVGLGVARFKHQLSCLFYIQQSERGGELVIYNRLWRPSDERFRDIGFGYSRDVISEGSNRVTKSLTIKADAGDLLFMNPRYFHEIRAVTGRTRRITLGMFLAFNHDEHNVVTWS